jgi:hypothetical protein
LGRGVFLLNCGGLDFVLDTKEGNCAELFAGDAKTVNY